MNTLISIIIPSYNNKIHLTRLLKSINSNFLKYPKLRNLYEIIVVDDGSKENLYSLKNCFNFFYIKKINGGAASARNKGVKFSKGKYLLFIDSDLELKNDFLNDVLRIIDNKTINVLSFYYDKNCYKKNLRYSSKLKAILDIYMNYKNKSLFTDEIIHGQCVIFTRRIFEYTGGWDSNFKSASCEHEEYSHRISLKSKMYTNFKIGPYHYYKNFWHTLKDVFDRSSVWSELYIEKKVKRDSRFKILNIFISLIPISSFLLIFINYKISFLMILFFYIAHYQLYKLVLKEINIKLFMYAFAFYPIIFTSAILGSINGLFLLAKKNLKYK